MHQFHHAYPLSLENYSIVKKVNHFPRQKIILMNLKYKQKNYFNFKMVLGLIVYSELLCRNSNFGGKNHTNYQLVK